MQEFSNSTRGDSHQIKFENARAAEQNVNQFLSIIFEDVRN